MRKAIGLACVGMLAWSAGRAGGAVVDPNVSAFTVPDFYGSAGSTYQEWAGFSAAHSASAPSTSANTGGTATWIDSTNATDGAFLIGAAPSGHVYSFSGVVHPEVVVPVQADQADKGITVVLQALVAGSGLDTSSFTLATTGTTGIAPTSVLPIDLGTDPSGGEDLAYQVTWTDVLAGAAASPLTIDYAASGTSSSQVAARVDTSVPEPAVATGVAGIAAIAGLRRRRRRA